MKLKLISINYYKILCAPFTFVVQTECYPPHPPKYPNYLAPYPLFALFLLFFIVLLDDVVVVVVGVVIADVPISFPTSVTISLSIAS